MNIAVIVGAGSGTRFGTGRPKQFAEIGGKPIIFHSVDRFEESTSIDSIVVVVAPQFVDETTQRATYVGYKKLRTIAAGGPTRAASVRNGLAAITSEVEIVAVHDAARPLVRVDEIDRSVAAAREFGAACLTAPVTETIKLLDGEMIRSTIDRRTLCRALTPQAFRYDLLMRAFENAVLDETVTDESYLVERLGHAVASVPGSSQNIKITYPEDIEFARSILSGERRS